MRAEYNGKSYIVFISMHQSSYKTYKNSKYIHKKSILNHYNKICKYLKIKFL